MTSVNVTSGSPLVSVSVSPFVASGVDAPANGTTYGRKDGAWVATVNATGVTAIVALAQAQYDALDPPDAGTLYVIT